MPDPSGEWPSEKELEAQARAAWARLSAEEKLELMEHVVSGMLSARESFQNQEGRGRAEREPKDEALRPDLTPDELRERMAELYRQVAT
jgi:hypothetical protein